MGDAGHRVLRFAGWIVALNTTLVLLAVGLGGTGRGAAAQFAAWYGIG